ncbi:hypothetical protein J2X65_001669 [Ancylobacter sp. 3268]|uniref:hypothetical protein n=1 Tax=Ancylobacter sp. 3268 TaxID=2817752 RepID=UPI00285E27AC|nr:hypothetical protein [Ancylobacter sp. 3268]MDR6952314.1 hypothetical protein [Ancylobacter sp. 3268]
MKLLADRFLLDRPRGHIENEAHGLLKLPKANHLPSPAPTALCDRFVFGERDFQALQYAALDVEAAPPGDRLPVPCNPMWIDIAGRYGWLISGGIAYAFHDCAHWGIRCVGQVCLTVNPDDNLWVDLSDFAWDALIRSAAEGIQAATAAGAVVKIIYALSSPRAATARRVVPGVGLDRGLKAFALRRAQRGLPVFSYNKVELIRPQTALYRGELRSAESLSGTRMHMVIGHWRLIDGVIEPYWIWVDGHSRGNPDLGTIVKERHVRLSPDAFRKGFRVPADAGHTGERRVAR